MERIIKPQMKNNGKWKTENGKLKMSAVQKTWQTHFDNATFSLINGFYQRRDLHPAQLRKIAKTVCL